MKNMTYWKAKNGLPGINNDFEKGNNLTDGRSKSSPFQKHDGTPDSNTKTHFADGSPKSKRDKFNDKETKTEVAKEETRNKDGVPRKNTKGAPLEGGGTSWKTLKKKYNAIEAVNDIGDEIEWLGEDYFNDRMSKSQYEAKLKILRMKEDAAIKANKATTPTTGL